MAVIDTRSSLAAPVRPSANSTTAATSITNPADKLAAPAPDSDGVIAFGNGGSFSANGLVLVPYGVGSDTNTFLMSVFAWEHVPGASGSTVKPDQYTAYLLASFTCTLSSSLTGVATGRIPATTYYCKTISLNQGNANVSVEVVSPGTEKASIRLDGVGTRWVEVLFAMNNSATSANALYRRI